MDEALYLLLVVLGTHLQYCGAVRPVSGGIPTFQVDLDSPPRHRWDEVLQHFDGNLTIKGINEALETLHLDGVLKPLSLKIAADLDSFVPQPYADEMRGISESWNVPLGYIVIGNIFYDLSTYGASSSKACTSIVANDCNGNLIHGRNLDYNFSDVLTHLVTHIEYKKKGKTLYHSVSYAGQVGFVTAFRPGAFSLTLNERDSGKWWDNVIAVLDGSLPTFFYFREVMEKTASYEDALNILSKMHVIAPAYIIVGGIKPYEGAVVIGDRNRATTERMNNTNQHGWFVVETNYDPWTKPPLDDDRRDVAIKLMKTIGERSMVPQNLFQVLSTPPILNTQTTYTTLMSAKNESLFHTVVYHH